MCELDDLAVDATRRVDLRVEVGGSPRRGAPDGERDGGDGGSGAWRQHVHGDGGAVNGNFWFFYAGLTDLEYDVTVSDLATGAQRTYHNAAGDLCGEGDTSAFPEGTPELEQLLESLRRMGVDEGILSQALNEAKAA